MSWIILRKAAMKQPKKELFNEVWFYYKKWLNHTNTDSKWEQILAEGDKILEKYQMDPFARSLVSSVIVELGRK